MVVAHFLNTAMLYYAVSRVLNDSFTSKVGLVLQITSLILISGAVNLGFEIFNPFIIWRSLKLYCKYRNHSDDDKAKMFQKELNHEFKYVEFDLASHYAYYILMSLTVSFYAYLVPAITPILVIFFIFQYWVDKINLFRKSSLKYHFNFFLTRSMLKAFEVSVLIFAIGWNLFSVYIEGPG